MQVGFQYIRAFIERPIKSCQRVFRAVDPVAAMGHYVRFLSVGYFQGSLGHGVPYQIAIVWGKMGLVKKKHHKTSKTAYAVILYPKRAGSSFLLERAILPSVLTGQPCCRLPPNHPQHYPTEPSSKPGGLWLSAGS